MPPKSSKGAPPPVPGFSLDGRAPTSVYWGKHSSKVKMCPHVRPGGGQCGLAPEFCLCMCLLCQSPMHARKRCNALMPDGSRCVWGQDRSPEVSTPEQSPDEPPRTPPITPATSLRRPYHRWMWTEHGGLVPYPDTGKKRPWCRLTARNYLEPPTSAVLNEIVVAAPPSASVAPEVPESMTTPPPSSRAKQQRLLSDVATLSLVGAAAQARPPSPPKRVPTTWNRTAFATMPPSRSIAFGEAEGEQHGELQGEL